MTKDQPGEPTALTPSLRAAIAQDIASTWVLLMHEARNVFRSAHGCRTMALVTVGLAVVCGGLAVAEELALVDGTRALLVMLVAAMTMGALAAITISIDVLAGERERGALMSLLFTPMSRGGIVVGKLGAAIAAWLAILLLTVPLVWAFQENDMPWTRSLAALALLGTPVVIGFGAVALAIAAWCESKASTVKVSFSVFAFAAGPLLLGSKLAHSMMGGVLDAIDPVFAAAHALRAIVIGKQSFVALGPIAMTLASFLALALMLALLGSRWLVR